MSYVCHHIMTHPPVRTHKHSQILKCTHMHWHTHNNTHTVCHDSGTQVLTNPASLTETPTDQQLFPLDPSWGRKEKSLKDFSDTTWFKPRLPWCSTQSRGGRAARSVLCLMQWNPVVVPVVVLEKPRKPDEAADGYGLSVSLSPLLLQVQ